MSICSNHKKQDSKKHIKYYEADVLFNNWTYEEYFLPLPSRNKWMQRWVTLKEFADINLNVSVKQRLKLLLNTRDMNERPYVAYYHSYHGMAKGEEDCKDNTDKHASFAASTMCVNV